MHSLRAKVVLIMSLAIAVASQGEAATSQQSTPNLGETAQRVSTQIHVDTAESGLVFGGVGAISGGGGNSRLLIDYPQVQRDQILDYLFKPGYGAALQMLKLEIGGDANSTDGSEPSVEHTRGAVNCNAGYEFWLAKQAKLRNPNIKLYGLAWSAPGWIDYGSNFWSKDTINYLMTWMGCAQSQGLKIDYLGGWNERGFNKLWYEDLHAALTAKHYPTQVVGDDSDWDEAKEMVKDPDFASSIDIVAAHYSCEGGDGGTANHCHSTPEAIATHKPLWDSESGSQDDNSGTGPLIRAIIRGYVDAKMTGFLNWPLIAAITANLPYPTVGLMVASQPWSGNYSIGTSLWATAHVTQFTRPGWQFLNSASGYLGGDRANGSYITLKSPDGAEYSTIVETAAAKEPSLLTLSVSANPAKKPIQVWATDIDGNSEHDFFVHQPDLNPDATGRYQFKLLPGYIYTFSTVTGAGKGTATAPPPGELKLPYSENFEGYQVGQEARYLSDMQGSFETQPCAAGRPGMCLQQMDSVKPIEWQDDSDAFTLLGDPSWENYTLTVDALLTKPGTVELIGRAGIQERPQSHQQGYYFRMSDTGSWSLLKTDTQGKHTDLGQGFVAPIGIGSWHTYRLSFNKDQIAAYIDGTKVTALTDAPYQTGQIGLGFIDYDTNQFDNLSITPTSHQ